MNQDEGGQISVEWLQKERDFYANRARELDQECDRLRTENASLVDHHNRESHGTLSHEAMAYDDVKRELDRLKEWAHQHPWLEANKT